VQNCVGQAQTIRYVLDRARSQCHHCTSLLSAQRQIRRILGGQAGVNLTLKSRTRASRSGLGFHLEREPARVIARGGARRTLPQAFRPNPAGRFNPGTCGPRLADRRVRVLKTVPIEHQRRVTVREKDAPRTTGKISIAQPSTNFYATNFELGEISPLFIHQFSCSRWRIDTEVFQSITTDLSPQTPRGPSNHRPGGADHDPVSGLYPVPGLLPPPSLQPRRPKMPDLSGARQAPGLLVRRSFAQYPPRWIAAS